MNIVLKSSGNVYEQIVEQYKKYIDLDVFLENDKLPSCRALAKELGVNPNTVEKAYRVLEEDGYITVIPKKGVYVSRKSQNVSNNEEIIKQIIDIKNKGIMFNDLLDIIKNVYKEELWYD